MPLLATRRALSLALRQAASPVSNWAKASGTGAAAMAGSGSEGAGAAAAAGSLVGEITSGALSPTLGYPIAMAYVRPDCAAIGNELAVDVRGSAIPATVVALPFYRRNQES